MAYITPRTSRLTVSPPPAKFRMASKPSNEQVAKMAGQSQAERQARRAEQASRRMRLQLAVGAVAASAAVAITGTGGMQAMRDRVSHVLGGVENVAAKVFGDPAHDTTAPPSVQTVQHDVAVQRAHNDAAQHQLNDINKGN